METDDLLLLVGIVVLGVIAIAYIVFSLSQRGGDKYLLNCPPCNKPASSQAVPTPMPMPQPAPQPQPMPQPSQPQRPPSQAVVFRNRVTGKNLSLCEDCVANTRFAVSAQSANPAVSYSQWFLTPATTAAVTTPTMTVGLAAGSTGYYFTNAYNKQTLRVNAKGIFETGSATNGDVYRIVPQTGGGYAIVPLLRPTMALRPCCPSPLAGAPACACTQFSKNAVDGIVLGKIGERGTLWDALVASGTR